MMFIESLTLHAKKRRGSRNRGKDINGDEGRVKERVGWEGDEGVEKRRILGGMGWKGGVGEKRRGAMGREGVR